MASKPQSFKLDTKKKTITIYTNVEQNAQEKYLIELYLKDGYSVLIGEKKTKSVDDMRAEMNKDKTALAEFNKLYEDKDKGGFFEACKYYSNWKKEKAVEKMRKEMDGSAELAEFDKAYAGDEKQGYAQARKIYLAWKKANSKKK